MKAPSSRRPSCSALSADSAQPSVRYSPISLASRGANPSGFEMGTGGLRGSMLTGEA
jgi:hypothetical protein